MTTKNFFGKIIPALIVAINFFVAPIVHAEIKTYTGNGEYIMSEFETLDIAKQRAKQKAERNAQEQAGVFVDSYTKVRNAQITEDEIIAITNGILNVLDVQYKLTPSADGKSVTIVATIQATINSDDVQKWLEKGVAQISELTERNKQPEKAIEDQNRQIAELKKQIGDAQTRQDKDRLTQEFAAEDKIFLANQKCEEGNRFFDQNNYQAAISKYNEAINLNPNYAFAYNNRGLAYAKIQNYQQAISDYTQAINLNPNHARAYFGRGLVHEALGNQVQAAADFAKARQLGYTG